MSSQCTAVSPGRRRAAHSSLALPTRSALCSNGRRCRWPYSFCRCSPCLPAAGRRAACRPPSNVKGGPSARERQKCTRVLSEGDAIFDGERASSKMHSSVTKGSLSAQSVPVLTTLAQKMLARKTCRGWGDLPVKVLVIGEDGNGLTPEEIIVPDTCGARSSAFDCGIRLGVWYCRCLAPQEFSIRLRYEATAEVFQAYCNCSHSTMHA